MDLWDKWSIFLNQVLSRNKRSYKSDKGMENVLNWTGNTTKIFLEHKKHFLILKWHIWRVLTIRNWPKSLILAILTCMKFVWLWKVEHRIENLICYKMSTIKFYYIFLIWELNKQWPINGYSLNIHWSGSLNFTILIHWTFSEVIHLKFNDTSQIFIDRSLFVQFSNKKYVIKLYGTHFVAN